MGLVHTIPQTDVTRPTFLRGAPNGQLPHDWLRSPEASTSLHRLMFTPVSYAMQAMHFAAADDEVLLRTTGRYRTYDQQVTLFRSRFRTTDTGRTPPVTRAWQGQTWWMLPGVALAATPGTSNHGLGLADDIAEQNDADPEVESIDDVTLQWLKDNAGSFGFALDIHSERWHWHWHRPGNANELTQRTVDVLAEHDIAVPDLARFGFITPKPSAPTPPPPPSSSTYVVVAGDSWWAISRKLGVTMDALIAANPPATTATVIRPGQILNVPANVPAPAPPPDTTLWATPEGTPSMRVGATDVNTVIPGVANEGRVSWLQAIHGRWPTTGVYDAIDAAKVQEHQRIGGIHQDGVYGEQTEQLYKGWRGR